MLDRVPLALVVSGPPGAGKSTVARLLASSLEPSVHLHSDDYFAHVVGGYREPWLPEAHHQNEAVMRAVLAAGGSFLRDGYHLVLDGVMGPWFTEMLRAGLPDGIPINYVILLPDEGILHQRVADRASHGFRDRDATAHMYLDFDAARGGFEKHIIDNGFLAPEETVRVIREGLGRGAFVLNNRA